MRYFAFFLTLFFGGMLALPAHAYNIKNDFCGVHINFQYCKCAFHNQYCSAIGMDQGSANNYIYAQFNDWVAKKEAATDLAKERQACLDEDGEWIDEQCVLTNQEEENTEEEETEEATEEDQEKNQDEVVEEEQELTEEEKCLAKTNYAWDAKKKTCSCKQLYEENTEKTECYFQGDEGIDLDVEAAIELQEQIEGMEPGEGIIFESENKEGKTVKVGIIRKPDGTYEFTKDGINWFDNAKDAVNPSFVQKIKTGAANIWRTVTGWFGVNKFVGKGTGDNPEKQAEGQARLDASIAAFSDLRKIGDDPEKQYDDAKAVYGLWSKRAKTLGAEDYDGFVFEEIKNATGYDVQQIHQVLTGNVQELTKAQVDSIKGALYTFPADAVETLAKELRKNDFANGASLYMNEREAGSSPEVVYEQLLQGNLPELEYKQLTGVALQYAQASMLLAYEDAYQRYLIAKEVK